MIICVIFFFIYPLFFLLSVSYWLVVFLSFCISGSCAVYGQFLLVFSSMSICEIGFLSKSFIEFQHKKDFAETSDLVLISPFSFFHSLILGLHRILIRPDIRQYRFAVTFGILSTLSWKCLIFIWNKKLTDTSNWDKMLTMINI